MIISIHQPEHFPYVGFFQKMEACDLFVILDDVQFTKNNFQNRNRFLNKNNIEEWFTIPIPSSSNTKLIKDIMILDQSNWQKKITTKILQNLKIDVSEVYKTSNSLLYLNMASINFIRQKLSIDTPMIFSSTLNIESKKSSRLLDICKNLNATSYLSGRGGIDYLEQDLFIKNNIELKIFNPQVKDYYTTLSHLNNYENIRNISRHT